MSSPTNMFGSFFLRKHKDQDLIVKLPQPRVAASNDSSDTLASIKYCRKHHFASTAF